MEEFPQPSSPNITALANATRLGRQDISLHPRSFEKALYLQLCMSMTTWHINSKMTGVSFFPPNGLPVGFFEKDSHKR